MIICSLDESVQARVIIPRLIQKYAAYMIHHRLPPLFGATFRLPFCDRFSMTITSIINSIQTRPGMIRVFDPFALPLNGTRPKAPGRCSDQQFHVQPLKSIATPPPSSTGSIRAEREQGAVILDYSTMRFRYSKRIPGLLRCRRRHRQKVFRHPAPSTDCNLRANRCLNCAKNPAAGFSWSVRIIDGSASRQDTPDNPGSCQRLKETARPPPNPGPGQLARAANIHLLHRG